MIAISIISSNLVKQPSICHSCSLNRKLVVNACRQLNKSIFHNVAHPLKRYFNKKMGNELNSVMITVKFLTGIVQTDPFPSMQSFAHCRRSPMQLEFLSLELCKPGNTRNTFKSKLINSWKIHQHYRIEYIKSIKWFASPALTSGSFVCCFTFTPEEPASPALAHQEMYFLLFYL